MSQGEQPPFPWQEETPPWNQHLIGGHELCQEETNAGLRSDGWPSRAIGSSGEARSSRNSRLPPEWSTSASSPLTYEDPGRGTPGITGRSLLPTQPSKRARGSPPILRSRRRSRNWKGPVGFAAPQREACLREQTSMNSPGNTTRWTRCHMASVGFMPPPALFHQRTTSDTPRPRPAASGGPGNRPKFGASAQGQPLRRIGLSLRPKSRRAARLIRGEVPVFGVHRADIEYLQKLDRCQGQSPSSPGSPKSSPTGEIDLSRMGSFVQKMERAAPLSGVENDFLNGFHPSSWLAGVSPINNNDRSYAMAYLINQGGSR